MRRPVFLSTFLFAAVLSPITLNSFTCAPPADARLSVLELRVGDFNGENVIEGFSPNVFSYDVRFPEEESVGVLWVRANHPSANVDVYYNGVPVQLVGQSVAKLDIPPGPSELTIDVETRQPPVVSQTYVVRIERVPVFPCTEQGIRDAIARGGGPIYFDCDEPTTVLTEAEIVIDNDVILDGEGNMIVDAGGNGTGAGGAGGAGLAESLSAHRVFSIPEGVTAELIGFTVTGGITTEAGGGILNEGTCSLAASTVSGNHADIGGGVRNFETGTLVVANSSIIENSAVRWGGGIHSLGQADIIDSTVSANTAELGGSGLTNFNATMTVTGSMVADNSASGILNFGGHLVVTNTAISGNRSRNVGGGISNAEGGVATIDNSTVSSNTAPNQGGGIANRAGGSLTLVDTAVQGNTADAEGGGVYNEGIMTLTDGNVSGNHAGEYGGGIFSVGSLEVTGSTISGNTAVAGGGIENVFPGTFSITNSTVSDNTATRFGGGIYNHNDASAEVVGTIISNNIAMVSAGGISNRPGATMSLTNSTTRGNTAEAGPGGGIHNAGTMTMSGVQVSSNSAAEDGGGVYNNEVAALTAVRCTVFGNTAGTWGGGIRNFGAATITETTVSNNTAQGGGGVSNRPGAWMALTNSTLSANQSNEISNWSTLSLASVTISGNGILNDAGWITATNTIFDTDCDATPLVDSLGGNIESAGNSCGLDQPTDLVNVPVAGLNLGPLADNGGPTQTHALLPGSVAIDWVATDACVNAAGFPLLVDQRGAPRPYGPACDSGSFELGAVPLPGDLCINDADRAVYESLNYINGGGIPSTCIDAATAIAADCVFGSAQSSPPIAGCPAEIAALIACYPNCTPEVIEAVDQCITTCTADVTGLSTACAGCYGGWAGCAAHVCVPECAGGVSLPSCTDCLFYAGCTGRFDACTGLPGDIDCSGTGGTPVDYTQDFESLVQTDPNALSDDGWLGFVSVFDGGGAFKFGYGPFGAPNGVGTLCDIDVGQGGVPQGDQQLVVYSDYNCCWQTNEGHFNGTDVVQSFVFQEPFSAAFPIPASAIGKTVVFSFDAKRGNINDPSGDSTAYAFVKTLNPDGFATSSEVTADTTNLATSWDRLTISLPLDDPFLEGHILQFGFSSRASNFEPSGVFYDNIVVALETP